MKMEPVPLLQMVSSPISCAFLKKKHSSMPGHTVLHPAFAPRGPKRLKFQAGLTWITLLSILGPFKHNLECQCRRTWRRQQRQSKPGKSSFRKLTCLGAQAPAHRPQSVPRGGALGSVQPGGTMAGGRGEVEIAPGPPFLNCGEGCPCFLCGSGNFAW